MFGVGKKLSALLPSSAKSQLQNALTIEWDQNKTVLVDLEGKGDRSDEVELNGFGSASSHLIGKDRSEYGRLGDDENVCRMESDGLFNQSTLGKSRSNWSNATLYGAPGASTSATINNRLRSGSGGKKWDMSRQSSTSDYRSRQTPQEENPFDENSPTYHSGLQAADAAFEAEFGNGNGNRAYQTYVQPQGFGASRGYDNDVQRPKLERLTGADEAYLYGFSRIDRGEQARQYQQSRSRKGDPWATGGWSGQTSPTSSRGTRDSAQLEVEDPFK